jgi:hypothetical protein
MSMLESTWFWENVVAPASELDYKAEIPSISVA